MLDLTQILKGVQNSNKVLPGAPVGANTGIEAMLGR
jgi:hypothetical protein